MEKILTRTQVLFGWLGDHIMRRRTLLLVGLVMLMLATALLAIPGHIEVLVLGRLLQGLSAAVVWTSGLALITETYGKAKFGEMLGYVLSSVSVGSTAAPLLGALVYSRGGYRAVTGLTVGTVALVLVMRLLWAEENTRSEPKSSAPIHDRFQPSEICVSYSTTQWDTYDTEANESYGRPPDETDPLLQKKKSGTNPTHPAAYLMLLGSPRILADLWGIFTYGCMIISFETLLPYFVKATFGWDAARSGLIFLAWVIPGFLAPLAGKLSDKFGSRWIIVGAFLFAAPPLVLLRLVTDDSKTHQILLYGLLTLTGIHHPHFDMSTYCSTDVDSTGLALAFLMPPLLSDLVSATVQMKQDHPERFGDSEALAQVYALFICAFSCGALVGPALAGAFKILTGWGGATLTLAIICAVACVPVLVFSGSRSR